MPNNFGPEASSASATHVCGRAFGACMQGNSITGVRRLERPRRTWVSQSEAHHHGERSHRRCAWRLAFKVLPTAQPCQTSNLHPLSDRTHAGERGRLRWPTAGRLTYESRCQRLRTRPVHEKPVSALEASRTAQADSGKCCQIQMIRHVVRARDLHCCKSGASAWCC